MRARLAIAVSGQRCELREVVLRDKPQALIEASAKATVPVLVLPDGAVLEQSLDIMLWALHLHDPEDWLRPQREGLDAMRALIDECDARFKPMLDRYKYPQRFAHEHEGLPSSALPTVAGKADDGVDAASNPCNESARTWAMEHRDAGARWLHALEARLKRSACLFGERPSLADMAVAPFVRQYAHVDREWFDTQPWPRLRGWLDAWMESALFARVMAKYRAWTPGDAGELFP